MHTHTHIQKEREGERENRFEPSVFFGSFFPLNSILTLLSVYCHASPALSAGLLQELMKYVYALERFWQNGKKR